MPSRQKTKYPGVYFRHVKRASRGKERVYYIVFKKDGRTVEEKVGRQFQDDMTPARAARIRSERIENRRKSRKEIRQEAVAKRAETIVALWELFYEAKQNNKSIRDDYYRWRKYLEIPFGNKSPADLVTLDIDRLRRKLTRKGLAPATVKQVLVLLKRIINYSIKRGLCPATDPSRLHFEMPKVNNLKTEDLTPDQLEKLLAVIEEDHHSQAGNIMKMALFTGMRRGELFRLQWEHIDYSRGFILLVDPKGAVDQKIPLNDTTRSVLRSIPRTLSAFVFPGRGGRQRTDIKKPINRIKERAGLPSDFRALHGLRHVYASTLASSGQVDMYTLQNLLTHKDPKMTQRYAHLRDDALKRAADVADNIFQQINRGETEKIVEFQNPDDQRILNEK